MFRLALIDFVSRRREISSELRVASMNFVSQIEQFKFNPERMLRSI